MRVGGAGRARSEPVSPGRAGPPGPSRDPPRPPDTAPDVSSRRSCSRPSSTSPWVSHPRQALPCREPGSAPGHRVRAPSSAPSRLSPCSSLAARLTVSYSRSSGPGGQNVNKGEEQLLPWKKHNFRLFFCTTWQNIENLKLNSVFMLLDAYFSLSSPCILTQLLGLHSAGDQW